jgi:hypothetical protein
MTHTSRLEQVFVSTTDMFKTHADRPVPTPTHAYLQIQMLVWGLWFIILNP